MRLYKKKQSSNGYFLFRKEVQSKLRSEGRQLTEDELKDHTDNLWEHLEEAHREEWKTKAKEDRLKLRSDTAGRRVEKIYSPSFFSSSFGPKPKADRAQKASVLQAQEDLMLAVNPDKRRLKDRKSFENAFTWHYETNRNDRCLGQKVQEEIDDLSRKTHQFSADDLRIIGKSSSEVADQLINMSRDRESSCDNIQFFILNWELNQTTSALSFLFKHSDLPEIYKNFNATNVATADDLAYGLFKFYDISYPKPSANSDAVDLSYLSDLIDGSNFGRFVCSVHDAYDADALCCLTQLHLTAEIIRRTIEKKKFDVNSLTHFASGVDSVKRKYYKAPASLRQGGDGEIQSCSFDEQPFYEYKETYAEPVENFQDVQEDYVEVLESSSDTLTLGASQSAYQPAYQPYVQLAYQPYVQPAYQPYDQSANQPVEEPELQAYDPHSRYGDVFLRAPDTFSVQNNLPSDREDSGFGRGAYLVPEGQLFERLGWMQRTTSI